MSWFRFLILFLLACYSSSNLRKLMVLSYLSLQVQAVLLLLGGREVAPNMPAIPISAHHNNRVFLCLSGN